MRTKAEARDFMAGFGYDHQAVTSVTFDGGAMEIVFTVTDPVDGESHDVTMRHTVPDGVDQDLKTAVTALYQSE